MEVANIAELRALKLVAEPGDIEGPDKLFKILKKCLDLPERVKSLKIEMGVNQTTTVELLYYYMPDKTCGIPPVTE